jgi:hypothetical protein
MLRRVLDGGARDAELNEEIRAFVEHDTESKIRSGMTPEDARRAALIELGGAEQVKERVREVGAGARWEGLFRGHPLRHPQSRSDTRVLVLGDRESQPGPGATIVAFAAHQRRVASSVSRCPDQDRLVTLGILESTPFGRPRLPPTALADSCLSA